MRKREANRRRALGVKGQSALEYMLIVGVVLAAIVAVLFNAIEPKVRTTVNDSGNAITKASEVFRNRVIGQQ